MFDRAGLYRKRFHRDERKRQIKEYITQLSGLRGYTTTTSIARRMGLTPSSHLRKMLDELWFEEKICGEWSVNSRGNQYIKWMPVRDTFRND